MRAGFVICIVLLLFFPCHVFAVEPPAKSDIDAVVVETNRTWSEFMEVTKEYRLYLGFFGRLDDDSVNKLHDMSLQVAGRFASITQRAEAASAAIEEYRGDDWENRYGRTGLWRRFKAEICRIRMFESQALYWSAMTAPQSAQYKMLDDINSRITSLLGQCQSPAMQLLKARLLLASAQKDYARRDKADEILKELCSGTETDEVQITAFLLRYKNKNAGDTELLEQAWASLKKNPVLADELWLDIGFTGWTAGRQDWLRETVEKCPSHRRFVAVCVLAEIEKRLASDGVQWIGPFAAGLAAEAAMENVERHRTALEAIGNVKAYRSAAVIYSLALAAEKENSAKAAAIFMEASKLMDGEEAARTAEHAARLMYARYKKDKSYCREAVDIMRQYIDAAGQKALSDVRYCCYLVMSQCGDANEARRLLEEIAGGESGEYQKRAACELGVIKASESLSEGKLADAADALAAVASDATDRNVALAIEIVARFLDTYEEYQIQPRYQELLKNCRLLAEYSARSMDGQISQRASILLAELRLLAGDADIVKTEELLSRVAEAGGRSDQEISRCRARLLIAKGDWVAAAQQWGLICELQLRESGDDTRNWAWWRAKYYQLLCWSKTAEATKEELYRRIEVIRSSCGPVPPLWDEKLKSL